MNTMLITVQQTSDNPSGSFAAQICAILSIQGDDRVEYGDWYLPSNKEWDLLDPENGPAFGGIPYHAKYWSSTEANETDAYQRWTGEGWDWPDKSTTNRVRAVRKF